MPLLLNCAHVCGVALSSVSLGAAVGVGAAVVCCSVSGLRGAVPAGRDEKPAKALGFKLVVLGVPVLRSTEQGLHVNMEAGG